MTFLFFLTGISVLGIGVVFWLLKKENSEATHDFMQPLTAEQFGTPEEDIEADEKPQSIQQPQQEIPEKKDEPPVLSIPENVKASLPPEKEEDSAEPEEEEKPSLSESKSLLDEAFEPVEPKSGKGKTSLFAKLPFIRKFIKPKIPLDEIETPKQDADFEPLQHVAPRKNPFAKIFGIITSLFQRKPKLGLSEQTPQAPKARKSLIGKLVNLVKFPKKKKKVSIDPSSDFVSLEDSLNINLNQATEELPEINISEESQEKPQAEDKKPSGTPQTYKFENELGELKRKYQNLEKLYDEKSSDLEKVQTSLENELNNRKEFNKVKDLMEKELKDLKDKTRESQSDLKKVTDESEGYKKRINQLEGKLTSLEKLLEEKNQEKGNLSMDASPEQMPEEPQEEPEKPSPEQEASTVTLEPLIKENDSEEPKREEEVSHEEAPAPEEPSEHEEGPKDSDDEVIVNLDLSSPQISSEEKNKEKGTEDLDQKETAPTLEEPQETQAEPPAIKQKQRKKSEIEEKGEKKEDLGSVIEKMLSAKDDAPKNEKPEEPQDKPETNEEK